jgi:hypothetical protein
MDAATGREWRGRKGETRQGMSGAASPGDTVQGSGAAGKERRGRE